MTWIRVRDLRSRSSKLLIHGKNISLHRAVNRNNFFISILTVDVSTLFAIFIHIVVVVLIIFPFLARITL